MDGQNLVEVKFAYYEFMLTLLFPNWKFITLDSNCIAFDDWLILQQILKKYASK